MSNNLLQNNQITVVGKILKGNTFSHEMYGEQFYEFTLEVPRLSELSDMLPIIISERLVTKNGLEVGTEVLVKGQFRSYNSRKAGENKLKLVIFARDIQFEITDEDRKNPNQVFLDGYICKQPVYRKTPLGREIGDIILAVNRTYHKSDYIPVITWGRNARFSETLQVGDNIKAWGRVQSREYEKKLPDETVVKKIAYEISVSKMEVSDTNNRKNEEEQPVIE